MLSLDEKKIKKRILDELVLGTSTLLDVSNNGHAKEYGIYANHVFVDFASKTVRLDYYPASSAEVAKPYRAPLEIRVAGDTYKISYGSVERKKVLEGSELKQFYDSHKKPK